MKLLFCAIVAAVTLLSLATAAMLPTPVHALNGLVARHASAPGPHDEDSYEKFWDLYVIGYQGVLYGYGGAFGLVRKTVNETERFDPTVGQEIEDRFFDSVNVLYKLYFEPVFGEEHDLPMPEVATRFHRRVAEGTEAVAVAERSIKSLVEGERPALLPRVQVLFALANAEMTVAWAPTVAYLDQFSPSQ